MYEIYLRKFEKQSFWHFFVNYRIVGSTNTCYYSENQIFLFFKVLNTNMPHIFFFKQKTAYEIMPSLVGSEMCIRDRSKQSEAELFQSKVS